MEIGKTMKKIAISSILLVLAACSYKVEPQLVAEPDLVTLRLADAADRATQSLEKLAAIEAERTPVDIEPITDRAPAQLRRSVTVEWAGPVEPLLLQLSDRAGYDFVITGSNPAVPLVVEVKSFRKPVIEVLRDVGLQLGQRASLNVDANSQTVEVVYANLFVE